ncbi:lipopolysaccharide biosynthesis protein [Geomonas limicola]|uniref:Lipopolysaccharide biosynthesis protein n=1 Tax=Geomonas limicola TaxID=2740186 RepID=A0A6V8NBF6_9BACT|nr:lipopolysaccharide biosynthesis protein [Geomonas limicola]GFO69184.1 lipopolysaccharide biosynthesis protein [Geomonas limicola]
MKTTDKHLAVKGIGYATAAKLITYLFSAASSVVLGRCLVAHDYGIASFAFMFVAFMEKFADIGIGSAIIQRNRLDDEIIDTAFTLKFVIGSAIALVTIFASGVVEYLMPNGNASRAVQMLALSFLFNNIYFLPNALLSRDMDFKRISLAETGVNFVNSAVAITMALLGFGYWSIIVAYLASSFLGALVQSLMRPVRITFRMNLVVAKELVNFGGYLFLTGLFAFLIANLANFIIGSVKGAAELGYFTIAFTWGSMICLIMYSIVLRVTFPLMSKLQSDLAELKSSYLKTVEYSGHAIVLANCVLFVVSREFLVLVLGHGSGKWLPALAALRIICAYGIIRGLLEPVGQVMVALGATRVLFKANLIACLVGLITIYPALKYFGIEGVAWSVTVAYLSQYLTFYRFLKLNLKIGPAELWSAVKPSFVAAVPVFLLFLAFSGSYASTIPLLAGKALLAVVIYLVTLGLVTRWEILQVVREYLVERKKLSQPT